MDKSLRLRSIWTRLLRSKRGAAGLLILSCILLAAVCAPWLAARDPLEQHPLNRRQPPTWQHPMGLDEVGRDNLSRVIHGARLSLWIGVTAVSLAMIAGVLLGAIAGYCSGWIDSLLTSLIDVMQAFPSLLLAIAVIVVLGRGLSNALYAVALAQVPTYARLMRVGVLKAKERGYVEAARVAGASPMRLLWRHILPECLPALQTQAIAGIGTVVLEVAGLSFLGLGVQPPTPEWGAMIAHGRGAILSAPHIVLFPGLAMALTVLGFNLLGDGLRDAADPRLEM